MVEEKNKISVLMAAYNSEKYISEAIESVLNQTYTNWELIVCDDCSDDNTFLIAHHYAKSDARIKVIQNKRNSRQSQSRNNAFLMSTGEYIAILDSDDSMNNKRLEKQISFLEKNKKYAFVGTNAVMFNEKTGFFGNINKEFNPCKENVIKNKAFVYASIMLRRKCFEFVNGYTVSKNTKTGEDYDLICKIYQKGMVGANLQENLYYYRVDNQNYLRRDYMAYYNEYKVAMKHVKNGWLKKNNVSRTIIISLFAPLIKGLVPQKIIKIYHKVHFKKNYKKY